jgi:3-methyl-2-oxobutanoate hydroxymethyltransferase
MKKITVSDILNKKGKEKISALTAYDYQTATILNGTDIDIILVGDSLGNVIMGYENTIPVTVEDMIHHGKCVVRGSDRALVVIDMPFMSYISPKDALRNAGRIIKETGASAVKLEGGEEMEDTVRYLIKSGIPVMGHIGLKPQSINLYGRYSVQHRGERGFESLLADAKAIEQAGAFSIIMELVPMEAAKIVTESLNIPTIGIGAGMHCDGQIQVINDILGYDENNYFKHSRRYFNISEVIKKAIGEYVNDIKIGNFPSEEESFD